MSSERSWLSSARAVTLCTFLSRVLGLARDVMMAALFGAGVAMDAFVLAFMVPNLFRRLFGEGAVSAAFVPVLTEYEQKKDAAGAECFYQACFTALLALLGALCAVGWVVCESLPRLIQFSATWRLFFPLLEVMFPFMPLVCLTALVGAALNVRRRFVSAAMTPVLLNVWWIVILVLFGSRYGVVSAAVAVLLGGVTQLPMVIADLNGAGIRTRLRWEPRHDGVARVARLVGPMLIGLTAMQVNTMVDGIVAQLCVPGSGANSALYYGNRLMQFPLGIFGAALSTALFPTFAAQAKAGDQAALLSTLRQALRVTLFIALPVTAMSAALQEPITVLVYRRGGFDQASAVRTGAVLMFYGLGMAAYFGNLVMGRVFYAFEDTRTPVRVSIGMVLLNLTLNLILVWPLRESGLALATAVCAFIGVGILLNVLRRRVGRLGLTEVARSGLRSLAASAACGAAAWAAAWALGAHGNTVKCLGGMAAGGVAFLLVAVALRMPELPEVAGTFLRRRRRAPAGAKPA